MLAVHFTVQAASAADWIDSCFHRREVMTGQHSTRLHLFAGRMAEHFCGTLLFELTSLRKALPHQV